MDTITLDTLKSIDNHISSKQYGVDENDKSLEQLLDRLATHLHDLSSSQKDITFAKEVVDAILYISKMHVGLDLQSKSPFTTRRNYRIETLLFEILNHCSSVSQTARHHLKTLCYTPKIFALFATSDDYRFQEVSGEFLWRVLYGEGDNAYLATFSFAGLDDAPLNLTADHSSSLARIFSSIKEKNLLSDLECFITSFNESLNEKQRVYSFTLVEMAISTSEKTEKFCAVEVFFSTSRKITFRVDDRNLYEFDFTHASLMDSNALEKRKYKRKIAVLSLKFILTVNKTREIAFSVSSSVSLPGFPARSEEDFYSLCEDIILKMEFQRNDTQKVTEALEKILFSLPSDKDMDVEKDSTKISSTDDSKSDENNNENNEGSRNQTRNKSSLVLRKSHGSINKSRENSMGLDSIFVSKQKSVSQITRKSSYVAMMVGNDFQEFDPHPQGSIISSLGEVLIPSLRSERMHHKKNRDTNSKDPFNDIFHFPPSFSSSSSNSSGSNEFDDISPIKPRPGEINDKDMLTSSPSTSSLLESSPLSSSSSSHKQIKNLEERINEIDDDETNRKEQKSKGKAREKSIRKYRSKKTAQKKKTSPIKALVNSFNAQTDNFRKERKAICELYTQSRTHFILLEKAMQDTLKEFSAVHTLVSKAAKTLHRIHRAYKYQKHSH